MPISVQESQLDKPVSGLGAICDPLLDCKVVACIMSTAWVKEGNAEDENETNAMNGRGGEEDET